MSLRVSALRTYLTALVLVAMPPVARAVTRIVPSDFTTIQDAIDASSAGDTVAIQPGDYLESITLRDDLVVLGSGASATRIRGFSGATLTVDSLLAGVTVRDLTLRAAPGIVNTVEVYAGSTPELTGLVIDGGTTGLRTERSSPRVSGCAIRSCTIGVGGDGPGSPLFLNDDVSDNLVGASWWNGATPSFHQCRLERNGLYNLQLSSYSAPAIIDASRNWWGTDDETSILLHIRSDESGPVTVIYVPWCADPGCTATPVQALTWGALRSRF